MAPEITDVADIMRSATVALFEGEAVGAGISMFVGRNPPGSFVELHTHPYPETFLLLEGRGRWTIGDDVVELEPEQIVVAPGDTPHGFRNIGDQPLLVITIHENGTVIQDDLGRDPA